MSDSSPNCNSTRLRQIYHIQSKHAFPQSRSARKRFQMASMQLVKRGRQRLKHGLRARLLLDTRGAVLVGVHEHERAKVSLLDRCKFISGARWDNVRACTNSVKV